MSLLEFNEGKPLTIQWQHFLLNQFHDVLPGSCLKEVVADALGIYSALLDELAVDGGRQLMWKGLYIKNFIHFIFLISLGSVYKIKSAFVS